MEIVGTLIGVALYLVGFGVHRLLKEKRGQGTEESEPRVNGTPGNLYFLYWGHALPLTSWETGCGMVAVQVPSGDALRCIFRDTPHAFLTLLVSHEILRWAVKNTTPVQISVDGGDSWEFSDAIRVALERHPLVIWRR